MSSESQTLKLKNKIRFVTATSLFDGHDASIHIMRRILQQEGAEVIHLGHNRSVNDVVETAIQEDAHGIAVSSYQGGHIEYFTYMIELLKEKGASHIKVFAGGGGVIVPEEIKLLQSRGVCKIFSPEDGQKMGLVGMIHYMLKECDKIQFEYVAKLPETLNPQNTKTISRIISTIEEESDSKALQAKESLVKAIESKLTNIKSKPLVFGFTGTGGAGKSSLVDEVILRFLEAYPQKTIAILSVDPTRRKTGGALLGDRIRMNSASSTRVFMRSMATRRANLATSAYVKDSIHALQVAGFDLVLLETAGIGQSDSEVTDLADLSIYVMTPEYGAPTQLEKIDMLDYADIVAINKFDKNGALDALREVRKTYQRNRKLFDLAPEKMPVFGTCAHRFNDLGTNTFFNRLFGLLQEKSGNPTWSFKKLNEGEPNTSNLIPFNRSRYLSQISTTVNNYRNKSYQDAELAHTAEGIYAALKILNDTVPAIGSPYEKDQLTDNKIDKSILILRQRYNSIVKDLSEDSVQIIKSFDQLLDTYQKDEVTYKVRDKEIKVENYIESLSHLKIPKVAMPNVRDWGSRIAFCRLENVPGNYPYTAGVFEFKRKGEDPTRMFAGEGTAEQTNRRFHYVSKGQKAARLSTAFDSVTLYGADPHTRLDIFGKIGNSGVSVCSLDDAKRLYSGFDLCAPSTSVSMTINGPAPTILAFFLNSAIDAAIERKLKAENRWGETEKKINQYFKDRKLTRPTYREKLPDGHDGMGLGFLGVSSDKIVDAKEYQEMKKLVLSIVRGTVQADILKEDQAQNTCIFSTEFAMRMMGDVQSYFIDKNIRNFYSVSISGYHIAEAGANPITQLAFTLANGFTLLEYYHSRGMKIDDFAPNLSFFFSNGLDPEYSVIGRVARRIWAVALKELYKGNDRSQKLKYHIQTSGRSLHAQEINFNDIRTTLQALYAISDNCNSLHTNAYDEAITTPTEESVRRAIAIQLIINTELGLTKNENPNQGSFFLEKLTDMVEEAVLKEFTALDARGGVLGAMETMYQRSKIQEESMYYEHLKHSGELEIIGVNSYMNPDKDLPQKPIELRRSSDESKNSQIDQVNFLHKLYEKEQADALQKLKAVAKTNENLFAELMEATKVCTLGSITNALYEVGGQYRRNM